MKHLRVASISAIAVASAYASAQTATYDTITGFENNKTYVHSDAALVGDLITPQFTRPVSKIEVIYYSTLLSSNRFFVKAILWSGGFQTHIASVGGSFNIPAITNPNVPETWLLTFSPVNVALTPLARVYGIGFATTSFAEVPGEFVPLFGFNPTTVGTDYTGFSIDTNHNGLLEPYLPIPDAEWYNPAPTSAHANLLCALYEMSQFASQSSSPQFTARKIDLGAYRRQALCQAADPLKDLR